MKSKTRQVVGFLRYHARHSVASQEALMDVHGIAKRYTDLDLLLRQRRAGHGDVIAIKRAMLLPDPKDRPKAGGMRAALYAVLDAIAGKGATLLELDTGRSTETPAGLRAIERDAVDDLAQTRKGTRRPGRPVLPWTADQEALMRVHWFDLRIPTNDAALIAMRKSGITVSMRQALRICGPSGRKAGFRPKRSTKR